MINVEFQQPQELMHLYQAVMKAKFEAPNDDLLFSPALADAANTLVTTLINQSRKSHNTAMADAMEHSLTLQSDYPQFSMLAAFLADSDYWQQLEATSQPALLATACAPLQLDADIEKALLAEINNHKVSKAAQEGLNDE